MWIARDGTNSEEIPLEFVPSCTIRRVVLVAGKMPQSVPIHSILFSPAPL